MIAWASKRWSDDCSGGGDDDDDDDVLLVAGVPLRFNVGFGVGFFFLSFSFSDMFLEIAIFV